MIRSSLAVCAAFLLTTSVMAADSGWVQRAPLTNARYGHQAVLLDNGSVLVAGGYGRSDYELNSELYNPTSNTWSAPVSMGHIHYTGDGFALVPLPNHHVLALDAKQGDDDTCEEYDPATNAWNPIAPLPDDRHAFKTVVLGNGDVLVVGGYTSDFLTTLATCWLYDYHSGTWTETGSLAASRVNFTLNMLPNGRVLATGGISSINGSGYVASSTETYTPELGTWETTGAMTTFRWLHQACVLRNGHVVVVSGVANNYPTSEEFTPKSNLWTATNDCTEPYEATFTAFGSGAVRAGGGPWWQSAFSVSSVDLFDEKTHTWSKGPDLHEARRLAAAVALRSGEVLVIGGTGNGFDALTGTELFGLPPKFSDSLLLAAGKVGKTFSFDVQVTAAIATYSATGLPPGIKLDKNTGHLSGKPTRAGVYLVPVTAKNAFGKAKTFLVVIVAPNHPQRPFGDG